MKDNFKDEILKDFLSGMSSYDLKEKYSMGNKKIIQILKTMLSNEEYEKIWKKNKNKKIKVSLTTSCKVFFIKCKNCETLFTAKSKKRVYCSRSCQGKDSKGMKKMIQTMKENVENGTHQGWKSRNTRSYPEIFFENVLNNHKLTNYISEYVVNKRDLGLNDSSNYFLDFFFPDKMIDLEIDGKQHWEDENRVKSDAKRDLLLNDNGYIVYRIKWKNPINLENKLYIEHEIQKFVDFYNSK